MINHRHSISIILFFIGLYASAFQYTVSGDVHTTVLDGQKAYLMLNDTNQLIDSAEITDGRFTMSGNAPREGWARVDAGREYALLILSPSVTEVDFVNHAPLSGDSVNMAYRRHKMNLNALENVARELVGYYADGDDKSKSREKMGPFWGSYLDYLRMTIQANADNAIAESALRSYAMVSTPEQWKELYPELPPSLLGLRFTRKWDEKMSTALRMRPGCMFADIEGKSVDGAVSRLSDYVGRGRYVLVDFWATWCMPCQMQGPVIEQLEKETDSFCVGKVNVDEEPELQMKYGISSIPSLLIFKNGECVNTLVGFHTKEQLIEEMSKYTQ